MERFARSSEKNEMIFPGPAGHGGKAVSLYLIFANNLYSLHGLYGADLLKYNYGKYRIMVLIKLIGSFAGFILAHFSVL